MGIQGEKVTHSCLTKRTCPSIVRQRSFRSCKQGNCWDLISNTQLHPKLVLQGKWWWPWVLSYFRCKEGFILLSFDIFLFCSIPVKTCTPKLPPCLLCRGENFWREHERNEEKGKMAVVIFQISPIPFLTWECFTSQDFPSSLPYSGSRSLYPFNHRSKIQNRGIRGENSILKFCSIYIQFSSVT